MFAALSMRFLALIRSLALSVWRRIGLTVAEAVTMERVVRRCVGLLLGIAGAVMGLWMTR